LTDGQMDIIKTGW